jgi:hypothetical protein
MKMSYCQTNIESDDSALLQYESLRSEVLKNQEVFSARSLGLALFIRQGMLAWMDMCHQCMPEANSILDKQPQRPVLAYETKSEMIKVMANITLFNLRELSHEDITAHESESNCKSSKKASLLLCQAIHTQAGF